MNSSPLGFSAEFCSQRQVRPLLVARQRVARKKLWRRSHSIYIVTQCEWEMRAHGESIEVRGREKLWENGWMLSRIRKNKQKKIMTAINFVYIRKTLALTNEQLILIDTCRPMHRVCIRKQRSRKNISFSWFFSQKLKIRDWKNVKSIKKNGNSINIEYDY